MLSQLIKMMWNRKGRSFLLLIELVFSFLVLFATFTLVINQLRNYYTPVGFDYEDVYVVDIWPQGEDDETAKGKMFQIKNFIRTMPEISAHSLSSGNTPFSFTTNTNELNYEGKSLAMNTYVVEPEYFETLDLKLAAGRWLQKGDAGEIPAAVINETAAKGLFGDGNPLGKNLYQANKPVYKIVGVIKYFRQDGEYADPKGAVFELYNEADENAWLPTTLLLEARPGAEPGWQQRLLDGAINIAGSWSFEEEAMIEARASKGRLSLIPILVLSIICGFLVFNVALGLYGVLWYSISSRYSEIGVRRAMGATKLSVRWQMVGELIVLATFGILLGSVLTIQFPLLGVFNVEASIYLLAMLASFFLIYLLVALCAWYPSRQASVIEPARALHYE
jgi:putative ABC transport system permease protein